MNNSHKVPKKPILVAGAATAKSEAEGRRTEPIRVVLSSRNKDLIPRRGGGVVSLLQVRKELQEELEGELFCGQHLVNVWINERAGGQPAHENIWTTCRKELRAAQVIIVIYNGQAGWRRPKSEFGICHEEVKYAFDHFPARLYPVQLDFTSDPALELIRPSDAAKQEPNRAFAAFLEENGLWNDASAFDDESLKEAVKQTVANAVSKLTLIGSQSGHRSFSQGEPLDWSRKSYQERKTEIERATIDSLLMQDVCEPDGDTSVVWKAGGARILLLVHGVPASFGIAEARELVGRPYLLDHTTPVTKSRGSLIGPIHLIACHKSCTESQIFSFMGHPDVYVAQDEFGFFAADLSSFAQTFFLTGCRDREATASAVGGMFEWIAKAHEEEKIVKQACSRQRILATIRAEIERQPSVAPPKAPRRFHAA